MGKARIKKKFNGYGQPVSLDMIRKHLFDPANCGTTLFTADRMIHLNIRFGELYHKCTDDEWEEILKYIEGNIGIEEPFFVRLKQKIKKVFEK
jgi:hypothetical protein